MWISFEMTLNTDPKKIVVEGRININDTLASGHVVETHDALRLCIERLVSIPDRQVSSRIITGPDDWIAPQFKMHDTPDEKDES